jgi:hypothetical protein
MLPDAIGDDFTFEVWLYTEGKDTAIYTWGIFCAPQDQQPYYAWGPSTRLVYTTSGEFSFTQWGVTGNPVIVDVKTADMRSPNPGGHGYPGYQADTWSHVALVRKATSPTQCDISIYLNGYRHAHATGQPILPVNYTGSVTTNGDYWAIGKSGNAGYGRNHWGGGYPDKGFVDEMSIFNSAKYSGTTLTVPTAPLSAFTNVSKLHVMDSSGSGDPVT